VSDSVSEKPAKSVRVENPPKAQNPFRFDITREQKPQEYYDRIKAKFAEERDLRLGYRPEGTKQYTSDFSGQMARYETDPYASEPEPRAPINDTVEVLFIGGGFSALLTSARLREYGVESIRIVERGADVGGTWYWNRYPGVACDVVSYDYLPLLDEMDYVPTRHYAGGEEILEHCRAIARRYDIYDLAVFQTTVTSTVWNEEEGLWHLETNRGDHMKAKFVVCANGTLSKPKLAKIDGIEDFEGYSFHTSRWDYDFTGPDLENLHDKVVGIIGTGASAVQIIPNLGEKAKELYVFQRTPSSIDVRDDWETDPEWAAKLQPGWQRKRYERVISSSELSPERKAKRAAMSQEEKIRRQENANIDAMMRIHARIDEIVEDPETADSLKPWYMLMCKRPCFHNDYLPTFNRPNVHLVDTHGKGITKITEAGPEFEGKVYEVDVLIYATGFEVQKTGIYNQILGKGGLDLQDKYAEGIRTLVGIHTHGFPNLFIMGGYQASFQFNLTNMLQSQGEHIAACIDHMRRNGLDTIDCTEAAEEWWVQEVIAHRGKTSRNRDCTPGYYNFEGEFNRRQDGNYNGSFKRYIEHMDRVRDAMEDNFILASL
jgi:cation diffusion facilitator CzcD-associated flavoprotein CzcO